MLEELQKFTERIQSSNKGLEESLERKKGEKADLEDFNLKKNTVDRVLQKIKQYEKQVDDVKGTVRNRAKELVGLETQQEITVQALNREAQQILKQR